MTKEEVDGTDRNLPMKKVATFPLRRIIGMKLLQRVTSMSTKHQWSRRVLLKSTYLNQVLFFLAIAAGMLCDYLLG